MEIKKSIKEIICIGTSFTEGDGLNPKNDTHFAPKWYLDNKNIKVNMTEYCWPTLLGNLSNTKTINLGKSGSSIEYLIRNIEEILETKDCKDVLFILEYSSWGRSELWCTDYNQWIVANWGPTGGVDAKTYGYSVMLSTDYNFGQQLSPEYQSVYQLFLKTFFNEKEYLIQRDRNFLNLLYKLETENISYQVIMLENPFVVNLKEHRLFNYKEVLPDNLWGFVDKHQLTITHETNGVVKNGHPSVSGHKYLANLFYDKGQNSIT